MLRICLFDNAALLSVREQSVRKFSYVLAERARMNREMIRAGRAEIPMLLTDGGM